jgi:hypothetical protein
VHGVHAELPGYRGQFLITRKSKRRSPVSAELHGKSNCHVLWDSLNLRPASVRFVLRAQGQGHKKNVATQVSTTPGCELVKLRLEMHAP